MATTKRLVKGSALTAAEHDANITEIDNNSAKISFDATSSSKLSGIEDNATADQTGAEIKTLYELEADTNAFTDAEKALLANQSGTNTGDQDLSGKQDTLVSGTNIKTINGTSVLGSGDISVVGGGGLASTDIDTLAELNAIVTDATLIDTTDARLSDARTPTSHNHTASEITDFDTEVSNNTDVAASKSVTDYISISASADIDDIQTELAKKATSLVNVSNKTASYSTLQADNNQHLIFSGAASVITLNDDAVVDIGWNQYYTNNTGSDMTFSIINGGTSLQTLIPLVDGADAYVELIAANLWSVLIGGDVAASDVSITDSGGLITATNVEDALQENRTAINLNTAKVGVTTEEANTIDSVVSGEPTGSDQVLNVVSLTQAEYDAGTPVSTTFYIITT